MSRRTDRVRHAAGDATSRGFLATAALLLFVWPVVAVPRLSLLAGWAHLFVSWTLVIVALVAMRRAPDSGAPRDSGGRGRRA